VGGGSGGGAGGEAEAQRGRVHPNRRRGGAMGSRMRTDSVRIWASINVRVLVMWIF